LFDAAYQVREKGNFNTAELEGFDLFGKTLGVLGTGAIGRNVVSIARGFGMRVLMFDTFPNAELESESVKYVPLDDLLASADIVTLHVPYVPENRHLINSEKIAKMKKGAFIVNTARGELIDTEALLGALKEGRIAGAGLDVLEEERALKDEMELVKGMESIHLLKAIIHDHMLIGMPRVIVTPHIAFFSREAYREIIQTSVQNISSFIDGKTVNLVAV
jgi:D-lactate dehydrogenase